MRALNWTVILALAGCGGGSGGASSGGGTTGPGGQIKPATADPAPVVDGDVTDAWAGGVHVLVRYLPGTETTATQLYIQGGVRNWSKADAGIEMVALRTAVTGGTERMNKDEFTRRLTELGGTIGTDTTSDYSMINAWSLTGSWNDTFAMVVDAFRHPALPASQLELMRARQLSGLRREQDDPDAKLNLLTHAGIYRGHPYENRAVGTLESVAGLKPAQIAAHLDKLRQSSRLLLVVVGGVEADKVLAAVREGLGELPRGDYRDTELPRFESTAGAVQVTEQKLPTNYIQAVFPGPSWSDPDYVVAAVAMSALGQREFEEVRTKRNLSYAPAAWFERDARLTFGVLYVTAVEPVETMKVMLDQARRLRDEPMTDIELTGTKSSLLTGFMTGQQTPAGQAASLAQYQMFAGDWRLARSLPERVRAVTAEQIKTWAAARMTHLRTFVIGDKTKIDQATLEAF